MMRCSHVYKHFIGRVKQMEPDSSQQYPVTGDNGHEVKYRNPHLKIRNKVFTVRVNCEGCTLEEVAQRGCEVSLLVDIQTQPDTILSSLF